MNYSENEPLNLLHTLERLSLSSNTGYDSDDEGEGLMGEIKKPEAIGRRRQTKRWRVSPYKLPRQFRRHSAPVRRRTSFVGPSIAKHDRSAFSAIRLHGCAFGRNEFPLFESRSHKGRSRNVQKSRTANTVAYAYRERANTDNSPSTSFTPCWKQHDCTADYVAKNQSSSQKADFTTTTVSASTSTPNLIIGQSSDSFSEPEIHFEVDLLSEYFQHFVSVHFKMPKEVESMYA